MDRSRDEQIAVLYAAEAAGLQRRVARRLNNVDAALVEDACAFAWAQLVRYRQVDPADPRIMGWMLQVAVREGWAQAGRQTAGPTEPQIDVPASSSTTEEQVAAREALALLDVLPERQRRIVSMAAAGLSREEIATAENATVRTIDRQLERARAALRAHWQR